MTKTLKRLAAPNFWPIRKKERKYVVKPNPGSHTFEESFPLLIILRDVLKLAKNAKEAKKILNDKNVIVDKKIRKDYKFQVGLFDSIEIKGMNCYRIVPKKKGLKLIEIPNKEINMKFCKIKNKRTLSHDTTQLNMSDGRNILIKNIKTEYKNGDTLLISLPDQKIKEHIVLEKDCTIMITGGKNIGKISKIKEIKNKMIILSDDKEVPKKYVFAIEKDKALLKVEESTKI